MKEKEICYVFSCGCVVYKNKVYNSKQELASYLLAKGKNLNFLGTITLLKCYKE